MENYNDDKITFFAFQTHIFKCQNNASGQYVLISLNDTLVNQPVRYFEITELNVFGRKIEPLYIKGFIWIKLNNYKK